MMGLGEIPESPVVEEFLLSAELCCGLARRQGTGRDARTCWGRVQTLVWARQAAGQYHLILI